jgi:hypothetical protein
VRSRPSALDQTADVACVREGGGGSDDLGLGLIRAVDRDDQVLDDGGEVV